MKKKNNILFYFPLSNKPAGGPGAVCYYYNQEDKKRGEGLFDLLPSNIPSDNHRLRPDGFIYSIKLVMSYLLIDFRRFKPKVDFRNYDIVYFHDTLSLFYQLKNLKNFKGQIILQSHTPVPNAIELFDRLPQYLRKSLPFLKNFLRRIDKKAFNRADYIVFPCPEAEETYINNWKYFNQIKSKKHEKFRYILTGIPEPIVRYNKETILSELGITGNQFIISYVGRHNEVKGFDTLKEIGLKFLEENKESIFLIAGKESPIKGLDHPQWKEIGWTDNAMSFVNASDVFILPNKETYFDIVAIEILALGKILIASRTGGNKFFENKKVKGVFLYDSQEEAIELLKKVSMMTEKERQELGNFNKKFYREHLSVESMYDSCSSLLSSITNEEEERS